jgi:hypothetical protein
MKKPQFIGIGAQRSGTTWLYSNLRRHQDFSLPFQKEIHYFDRAPGYPSPNLFSKKHFISRLPDPDFRRVLVREIRKSLEIKSFTRLKWFLKYYCSTVSDQWYLSLFDGLEGITGEITPSYSILDRTDIERIHRLIPDVRLVFLIRDPVQRALSAYRFLAGTGRIDVSTDVGEIIRFMDSPLQETRGKYLLTIENYLAVFGPGRLFLAFFDAIVEQPLQLMDGFCEFIGATPVKKVDKVNERVKKSQDIFIPDAVQRYLVEKYHHDIQALSERFGGYCSTWYQRYYGQPKSEPSIAIPVPFLLL